MSYSEREMAEQPLEPEKNTPPNQSEEPIIPDDNERYDVAALAARHQERLLQLIPDRSPEVMREIFGMAIKLALYDVPNNKRLDEIVATVTKLEATNRQLSEAAITDPLTGLFSRRLMDEDIEQRLSEGKRTGKPVRLLMIDLDRFKTINDTLGHQAGDKVLVEVANRLKQALREHDRAYRYGGEEIVALLDTDTPSAVGVSERLRTQVFGKPVIYTNAEGKATPIEITASIGVGSGDSRVTIVEQADRLVYHAKRTGRNRTAFMAGPDKVGTISGDTKNRQTNYAPARSAGL